MALQIHFDAPRLAQIGRNKGGDRGRSESPGLSAHRRKFGDDVQVRAGDVDVSILIDAHSGRFEDIIGVAQNGGFGRNVSVTARGVHSYAVGVLVGDVQIPAGIQRDTVRTGHAGVAPADSDGRDDVAV
jgi:hypothetical protein